MLGYYKNILSLGIIASLEHAGNTVGDADANLPIDTSHLDPEALAELDATGERLRDAAREGISTGLNYLSNLVESQEESAEHIVQAGDTLWKIVKNHYGLSSDTEIANTINAVVMGQSEWTLKTRLQKDTHGNDGIMWDLIYPGDVIMLPVLDSQDGE